MAAHKMNFFSAMTTADIPFDIAKNGQWELEMQAYCADRHMTYVPSLNLGQTLLHVRLGGGLGFVHHGLRGFAVHGLLGSRCS